MAFQSSIKVRFGDEDHAQIVYYPRFFDFLHQVFEDFFDHAGWPYRRVLKDDHVGWPAVHVEADYKSPLRFGDVLDVELRAERIGEKSATFAYRGTLRATGALVIEAKVVSACIDMRTFQAQPIPDKYRELFAKHLG